MTSSCAELLYPDCRLTCHISGPATKLFSSLNWEERVTGQGQGLSRRSWGKEAHPLVKHMRTCPQTKPEKPPKFLHCTEHHILQAAEKGLQMTQGLSWGGIPPPFFKPPSHICYYNNEGKWWVLEVKLGNDLGSRLLLLSIVSPATSLQRTESASFSEGTEKKWQQRFFFLLFGRIKYS